MSLAIPARSQVHLGFYQDGSPGDLVPAVQLLLLPVLNGMIVLFDFLLGLFFFRREETQALSYLLWGSGAFIALVFLFGTLFILQAG
ncbi:MAG: putative rane protein [Chloroflexi bacterium]|nr:putative rane protein [Chloroflexota bacterium]